MESLHSLRRIFVPQTLFEALVARRGRKSKALVWYFGPIELSLHESVFMGIWHHIVYYCIRNMTERNVDWVTPSSECGWLQVSRARDPRKQPCLDWQIDGQNHLAKDLSGQSSWSMPSCILNAFFGFPYQYWENVVYLVQVCLTHCNIHPLYDGSAAKRNDFVCSKSYLLAACSHSSLGLFEMSWSSCFGMKSLLRKRKFSEMASSKRPNRKCNKHNTFQATMRNQC